MALARPMFSFSIEIPMDSMASLILSLPIFCSTSSNVLIAGIFHEFSRAFSTVTKPWN
jgi:hypothetical protein